MASGGLMLQPGMPVGQYMMQQQPMGAYPSAAAAAAAAAGAPGSEEAGTSTSASSSANRMAPAGMEQHMVLPQVGLESSQCFT